MTANTENKGFVYVEGKKVAIENEKNLLEVIRKAQIELPTFCYHSELSVYGACRLCLVDIEGMGIQASCSIAPKDGMKVTVHNSQIREMRKTNIELLLAAGHHNCTTCVKTGMCKLQDIAKKLGIKEVRFKQNTEVKERNTSSHALVRDPEKCVLCGDCIRMCSEVQGIGVIDFVNRGSKTEVLPAFGKNLDDVECINCGQCVRICPTGALTSKSEVSHIWQDIWNPGKKVAVQVAPAVRVALGEMYGLKEGENTTGLIVTALRMLGFDYVYDTSYSADLTIFEEVNEFIGRFEKGEKLPLFTSCCPGWIKHAEHCYPELLENVSSCKSPQQMLASAIKESFVQEGGKREDISVVSVMPCTAKKFEAKRPEFSKDGDFDVSNVLTTMELARMIDEKGIKFLELEPSAFDMPFGFKTGAGIIFGAAGGVTEAVVRFVLGKVAPEADYKPITKVLHESKSLKEMEVDLGGGKKVRIAAVNGLKNAQNLIADIKSGKKQYDFVEIMACPNGCVGGAGQPAITGRENMKQRSEGLYSIDDQVQLHKSQDNHYIAELYKNLVGEVGGKKAHEMFHTHYHSRQRIKLKPEEAKGKTNINVCFGSSCVANGAKKLYQETRQLVKEKGVDAKVHMTPSFCYEKCTRGPVVKINDAIIEKADAKKVAAELDKQVKK
ncbi:MAG: [FeFe] hydrogenase, group A [Elusimicrobiota bacterium]|jgi:NADH-quinone oxidoreductase subunit G|nr:[FeFe] hydrogenase, group A [Elusimicrobiota bacterium]